MTAPAQHADSLRKPVLSGIAWKAGSQTFLQLTRMGVMVILARNLTPADFGLIGMLLVFSGLAFLLSDMALGSALIRRPELTEADRSTVFWTSVAVGLGFTLFGIALAGPIASFYGEPELKTLFIVLSFGFVLDAAGTTQRALLERDLAFRAVEVRAIVGAIAAGIVAVVLALEGYGPWALIAQSLTATFVSTTLLWALSPWRPRRTFSTASLRSLAGFSSNVLGTRVLFYTGRNLDNLLIGRFLGASSLGIYTFAYGVMLMPMTRIATPVAKVMFPAFSKIQNDRERLTQTWVRANRMIAAVTIPLVLGLIIVAPDLVPVLLGDQWDEAIVILQILAPIGLIQSLQRLNGSVLLACDRSSVVFRFAVVTTAANVVAFVVGLQWGIVGVATAYAIAHACLQPLYMWLTVRAIGISWGTLVRGYMGVAQAGALMAASVWACRVLLIDLGVADGLRLAATVLLGAVVYVLACRWRAPEVIGEIRSLRSRRTAAAPA